MNRGASQATSDIFLFLHADTFLPDNFPIMIEKGLKDNKCVWGRFDVRLSGKKISLRIIEFCMNHRSRLTGIATGDQAIFVIAKNFQDIKGYQDIPLMEDIALSKSLKKQTSPLALKNHVITSSRRWEAYGIWRTIFLMWELRLSYFLHVSPHRLAARYEKK